MSTITTWSIRGDTLRYTISIPVSADVELTFTDTPGENTTLVTGSVTTTHGSVTAGQDQGDTFVEVALGTVPAGATAIVAFDVVVDDTGAAQVCNQGTVSGTGLNEAYTDDPDVEIDSADPTCTDVFYDLVPPTFTYVPPDTSVNLGEDTSPENTGGYATAIDNITENPVVEYADAVVKGPLPFEAKIHRTWTATDEAGLSTSDLQTITIVDTEDRSLHIEQSTYGLFQPSSDPGNRQLGQISLEGDIMLLGTATSIYDDDISTSSGITAYSIDGDVVYFIGKTQTDGVSRIFTVDTADGSATSQALSFGTDSTVVGIWYDDLNENALRTLSDGYHPRGPATRRNRSVQRDRFVPGRNYIRADLHCRRNRNRQRQPGQILLSRKHGGHPRKHLFRRYIDRGRDLCDIVPA